jgi:hypothetical protein
MSNTRKVKPQSQLLSKGNYAIFQAPNGDGVIAYRPDGEEKDSHQVVPAKFWSICMKMLRGDTEGITPMSLMKLMIK